MELNITTTEKNEFIDITKQITKLINIKEGFCIIYSPHTTAAITINEGADPDVASDMIKALDKIIPNITFAHTEGNSDAHIKTSLIGPSETIIVKEGQLILGKWQHIFFCEFDGPRNRTVNVDFFGT